MTSMRSTNTGVLIWLAIFACECVALWSTCVWYALKLAAADKKRA